MRMKNHLLQLICVCIIIYIGLAIFKSFQIANTLLVILAIIAILGYLANLAIKYARGNFGSAFVPKQLVFDKHMLSNDYCSVKFTPNEKIMVMDNFAAQKGREIKTFTVTKDQVKNINNCWAEICKLYDSYTYLDTIASYFKKETNVNIILIPIGKKQTSQKVQKNANKSDKTLVNFEDIIPDSYSKGEPEVKDIKVVKNTSMPLINMEKMANRDNLNSSNHEEKAEELVEMKDVLENEGKTIDINTASAAELAILPGINDIVAKRLVEFRTTERLFTSKEDFIKISKLRPANMEEIENMIKVDMPKTTLKDLDI